MADTSAPGTLHDLVDAGARRHPGRTAVVAGDERLTYGELRRRSDAVAVALVAEGVRPESRVALYLPRSVDLIVAMLGVLKAGAAFVPIPPEYPAARIAQLLDDSGAALAFATDAADLPPGMTVLGVPGDGDDPATLPPRIPVTGEWAAYVMYTSGSTGRPKGAVITHANAVGLVRGQDYAPFTDTETFLQLSPTAFDASAFEIWGALLSGARLVLAPATYQAIDTLPEVLSSSGVTALFLTPALFHEFVRGRPDTFTGVRHVVVGGDVLAPDRARAFVEWGRNRPEQPVLVNGYGPTETTTFATTYRVTGAETGSVPIGRPLHGVRVHLLDAQLRPVPAGTEGDLYIAGSGVCRGYLGQPGVTARAFLPDPYAVVPGARMYRTGDRARLTADGDLEFLGRRDAQVKVRGHRIEPQEVELALSRLPQVREAAVVAEQVPDGDKQLVAHLVMAPGGSTGPADVRADLARVLPANLMPARFVETESLPRTPSGKLDRAALRRSTPVPGSADAPADRTQRILAEVWCQVLGVDRIGPDDDFFALGGDSMLAIRAITEAEARGIRLSLLAMFDNPVLKAVSATSESTDGGTPAAGDPGLPLDAPPAPMVYPASRLQIGLIFEAASSPDRALYHDVMAHRIEAPFDAAALQAAVDAVVAAHDVLRTRFDLGHDDGPQQVVEPRVEVPVSVPGGQTLDEIAAHLGRPFDVEAAPLLRVAAVPVDHSAFHLMYGFHHAVMDGWSDTVFLADLLHAYTAASSGAPAVVATPTTRYADFVRLEQETLASPRATDYWRRRCATLTPTLVAPQLKRAGTGRCRVSGDVPGPHLAELRNVSAALRVPLKSLFVAAHLRTLSRITGVDRPVTGITVNGRPEVADADRLVGLFLNIIPLTAGPAGVPWPELATAAFEAEREATEFRRYPQLAIRQLTAAPAFDVICNYADFRVWRELTRDGRITETRMWDRTSYPLVVDVVVDSDGGARLDVTGDTSAFTRADLERIAARHVEALTELAGDVPAAGR